MKQLVFDGQVLQTDAWYRGMGRYLLQTLHHLSEQSDSFKLAIIFNDNIVCSPERFKVFSYLCPGVEQIHVRLPVAIDRAATAKSYKKQLTQSFNKHFEQSASFVITSLFTFKFFAQFPETGQKVLLMYDLTPLLFWRELGAYFPPHLYMSRFEQIYEADLILTISDSVRQDVLKVFGLKPERVVNIDGGFTKPTERMQQPANLKLDYGYVLLVSGDLPHKNNQVAVRGFANFIEQTNSKLKLVITSSFSPKSQKALKSIYPQLVFSGNVTDEELEWLYANAQVVLFASLYEGLGIPILDAVFNNKPVVASRISVFEEMTKTAFYFFDPKDPAQLTTAIKQAVQHKDFIDKQRSYPKIMQKYSWHNTAEALQAAVLACTPLPPIEEKRRRVALVALNPGINAGLGRLAEPLHYWLRQHYEMSYYFDSCNLHIKQFERPTFLDRLKIKVADILELTPTAYRSYDDVIYLLDDEALEYKIAQTASVLPGILVSQFSAGSQSSALATICQVVVNNQKKQYALPSQADPATVAQQLQTYLSAPMPQSAAEQIIRSNKRNSVIMDKLLKLRHHAT